MTQQEKDELLYEVERLINNRVNSASQEITREVNQKRLKEEDIFNKLRMVDSWNLTGVIRHVTVAPTHTPKNKNEQFVLFDDGANRRLYLYVNGSWRYSALT
jgi:hypothetical protein